MHHDDVAAAIALAATTDAPPGAYNIAGDGEVSISDIVTALGGRPVRVPAVAATAASAVIANVPFTPSALEWLHVARASVVMDTSKAKSQLGWKPKYTSAETLQALAEAVLTRSAASEAMTSTGAISGSRTAMSDQASSIRASLRSSRGALIAVRGGAAEAVGARDVPHRASRASRCRS